MNKGTLLIGSLTLSKNQPYLFQVRFILLHGFFCLRVLNLCREVNGRPGTYDEDVIAHVIATLKQNLLIAGVHRCHFALLEMISKRLFVRDEHFRYHFCKINDMSRSICVFSKVMVASRWLSLYRRACDFVYIKLGIEHMLSASV